MRNDSREFDVWCNNHRLSLTFSQSSPKGYISPLSRDHPTTSCSKLVRNIPKYSRLPPSPFYRRGILRGIRWSIP
jgi:hypothetical protein